MKVSVDLASGPYVTALGSIVLGSQGPHPKPVEGGAGAWECTRRPLWAEPVSSQAWPLSW